MGVDPISRVISGAVARYRRRGAGRLAGHCRFQPSCSTFAQEALRTRALPVAVALIAWRLVRCNPLTRAGAQDPVTRTTRRRPRENAVATIMATLALAGFVVATTTALAQAQTAPGSTSGGSAGVTGGCTVTVNGIPAYALTMNKPLVVQKGQRILIEGRIPPNLASKAPKDLQSTTRIHIEFFEGIYTYDLPEREELGSGGRWRDVVNVDDYLKYGGGLYQVTAQNFGYGQPALLGRKDDWYCTARIFLRMKTNPFTTPIGLAATGLAGLGAAGALAASRPKKKPQPGPSADEVGQQFGQDVDTVLDVQPDRGRQYALDIGCIFAMAIMASMGLPTLFGAAAPVPTGAKSRRLWVRGHAVWGFVTGLLFGLGGTVLAQQSGLWTLTTRTGIVVPVLAAVLSAVRARIGRPYRVVFRPVAGA